MAAPSISAQYPCTVCHILSLPCGVLINWSPLAILPKNTFAFDVNDILHFSASSINVLSALK